jgi:hypothetical protein
MTVQANLPTQFSRPLSDPALQAQDDIARIVTLPSTEGVPDHIHRLTGRDNGSVSIHAYSSPLWRMGQYAVGSTGVLRRTSVSYADELRPLDDMI